jgi:hypothetical protein
VPLREVQRLAMEAERNSCTAKAILGLEEEQILLVAGFERDEFLERAWPLPQRRRLLTAIRAIRPDAAIAWGYSMWHRFPTGEPTPRLDHWYNLKRSLIVYAELQDIGVPAIPHMYWGLREDLLRWSEWLRQNPGVSVMAIDLQTVDADADWQAIIRDIRYFRSVLPRDIRRLFSGICEASRIRTLREVWPNSSLCNQGPFFSVAFPKKTLWGLRPRPFRKSGWSAAEFFATLRISTLP